MHSLKVAKVQSGSMFLYLDTKRATSHCTFCFQRPLSQLLGCFLQGGVLLALQRTDTLLARCQPQPQLITTLNKGIKTLPANIENINLSRHQLVQHHHLLRFMLWVYSQTQYYRFKIYQCVPPPPPKFYPQLLTGLNFKM